MLSKESRMCAWDRKLVEGNKVCYTGFSALNSLSLVIRMWLFPAVQAGYCSQGRFIPWSQGQRKVRVPCVPAAF